MTGFLHILQQKPLKEVFIPDLQGTLKGYLGLGSGAKWINKHRLLLTMEKGSLVFDLNTSWMLCIRFNTLFGDFCGCWGRVSMGTTVEKVTN